MCVSVELNKHINVAIHPKICAEDRPKEGQLANVVTPTQISDF
jgi:hypothetical protein